VEFHYIHPCLSPATGFTDWRLSLSFFDAHCVLGDGHFCTEVPTKCSVCDVLKWAPEQSEMKGVSLWRSGVELNLDLLFVDHFEPEAICDMKVGWDHYGGIP
jgi:hypothetical protein